VQSGGRRAGGIGMGMEAGYNLPWQRQGVQQALEQQRAQTGLIQGEQQNVNIPGQGPMPAWLAKSLGPAWIRAQGQENVQQQRGTTAENVQRMRGQTALDVAQTPKPFIPIPNVGMFDTRTRQIVPGTEQGMNVTPEVAEQYGLPKELIGKPMSMANFASLERANMFGAVPVMGAGGPALVQRNPAAANYGKVTPLGLGVPALGAPREIADVNNPGQTLVTTGAQAIGQPGVQSASVQAPKAAAKAEVPTKIGDLKIAFNTAIQHADLLRSAVTALNNGDQTTLNSLKNRLKAEFGVSGPVTAQAIADAYGREVTSVISKGHMTNEEIGSVGKTLNVNRQSPEQSLGVLDAYKALMQSKMNMLNQQKQSAIKQSQPKRADPLGIR
jgi:hypothetical protein